MIGADLAAVLPELRAQAESMMLDTCTIATPGTGAGTFDEDTGITTPPAPVTVYTGACRVQSRDVQPSNPQAGETEYTTIAYVISVPASVVDVGVGATVTVTAASLDADLVGRSFTVTGLVHKTYLTARRLVCEEVS
jgi:hypothetical protein